VNNKRSHLFRMTGHERQRVHGTATAGEAIRRPWSRSEINRCSRPHPSAAGRVTAREVRTP
jgi:hypothetical protein